MLVRVFVRNHSYENVFRIEVYFYVNLTYFHIMEISARVLVLKQRQVALEQPFRGLLHPRLNLPRQQLEARCYHNGKL